MFRAVTLSAVFFVVAAACGGAEGPVADAPDDPTTVPSTTPASVIETRTPAAGLEISTPPSFEGELTITEGSVADDLFASDIEVLGVFEVEVDGDLGGEATLTFETELVVGDDGVIPDVWIVTSEDGEVWRFTMDPSILVSDTGAVTVTGVVDAFSTVAVVKGSGGLKFVPRTVTAQVAEAFTASFEAMNLRPGADRSGGTRDTATGAVGFVRFDLEASGKSIAAATYRCAREGAGTFGIESLFLITANTDASAKQDLQALAYFFGAPAAALAIQDDINKIHNRQDRLVPLLSVTGNATCVASSPSGPGVSVPIDILTLIEAGEFGDDGIFDDTGVPLPGVDIASLNVEVSDPSSITFDAQAIADGTSVFGGVSVFVDTIDGDFLEFSFDTVALEDGTPDSYALGSLFDAAGAFFELEPPIGAIDAGFSLTAPLALEDDKLFVLVVPVDGTELPKRVEVIGLQVVLFRDDALATYEIPLDELTALLDP